MDLVDEQERPVERGGISQAREGDDGVERVVVVAEDDVGALRQLERDLERADFLGPRLLVDEVGLEVRCRRQEPVDEAGHFELGRVLLRVGAVVLVAEDDAVGAHPLLGAEADRTGGGGGDRLQRLAEDLLLGRLRRQDVELSPLPQRLDEHRQEGGGGLSDSRRGLYEELLPGVNGPRHGGRHLPLPRAEPPEREDEVIRLGRFRFGEGELAEELREDGPNPRDQAGLDLGRVPRHRHEPRVARFDVGQNEAPADRSSLGPRDGEEVPLELEREAVEAWRPEKARQLLGEMDRLHLVDDERPVLVLEAAVQAAFEDRREPVDGEREADRLLDRVPGNRRERFRKDAAVDGLAYPAPFHRIATAVPDAAGDGCEEGARREGHGLRGEVDPDRHAAFYGWRPVQSFR